MWNKSAKNRINYKFAVTIFANNQKQIKQKEIITFGWLIFRETKNKAGSLWWVGDELKEGLHMRLTFYSNNSPV